MRLTAVPVARVFVPLVLDELNPKGHDLRGAMADSFVAKMDFRKFPTDEQLVGFFHEGKAVEFRLGKWNEYQIDLLAFYSTGIMVDTSASTDISQGVIVEVLSWLTEQVGAVFQQEWLNRRLYVSQIEFVSELSLVTLNPRFGEFSERITKSVSDNAGQDLRFEPSGISFNIETVNSRFNVSPFSIDRLPGTPFSENKYISAAPLPTDEHIQLLDDLEAALLDAGK